MPADRKMLAMHRDKTEFELWTEAEQKARQEIGESAREAEVLAYICAEYLDKEGPIFYSQ